MPSCSIRTQAWLNLVIRMHCTVARGADHPRRPSAWSQQPSPRPRCGRHPPRSPYDARVTSTPTLRQAVPADVSRLRRDARGVLARGLRPVRRRDCSRSGSPRRSGGPPPGRGTSWTVRRACWPRRTARSSVRRDRPVLRRRPAHAVRAHHALYVRAAWWGTGLGQGAVGRGPSPRRLLAVGARRPTPGPRRSTAATASPPTAPGSTTPVSPPTRSGCRDEDDQTVTRFDLADPGFDTTSDAVHAARDERWFVETNWGWAVLRHAEAGRCCATAGSVGQRPLAEQNGITPAPSRTGGRRPCSASRATTTRASGGCSSRRSATRRSRRCSPASRPSRTS